MSNNSWKQYGGIRKQDKFQNLNIGTLVADQVLLRDSYAGLYVISGTLNVGTDLIAAGNVQAGLDFRSDFNMYVGKNAYIQKKLHFGRVVPVEDANTTYAFMFGDSVGNNIGVNTISPTSTFDIAGVSTDINVLTVRTAASSIKNVISQNVNNRGLTITSNDTGGALSFFIDTPNTQSTADAQIQYTSTDGLLLSSIDTGISSSGLTTITSGSVTINTDTLISITSSQTTMTATNTTLLSTLSISNRGTPLNLFNENTVIYDVSNGYHLYDAYENTSAFSGSAVTLVTPNNSTSHFRIVAANKLGLTIGGGVYANDQTRAVGSTGLTDTSGNYKVTQTIVSGNSKVKYLTTMGVNTYAPKTEEYVMDVNGPLRIGNGEINKMLEVNYEIKNVTYSKVSQLVGMAVGSATGSEYSSAKGENIYPLFVNYTSDGGVTWNSTRVDTTSDLETSSRSFVTYAYNSSYALLCSSNNFFYYTLNGGVSWNLFFFTDGVRGRAIRSGRSIYMTAYSGNTLSMFIVCTDSFVGSGSTMQIVSFTYDLTDLPTTYSNTVSIFTVTTPSLTTINANDGYGSFVYFVGSGIQKYQTTTMVSQYVTNTSFTYYGINVYSDTYAVAVGANVISYTTNGTTWTNITLSSTSVGNVTLRSVYIYSTSIAVAVGDSGALIYTTNGSVTWQVVPNSILNSSGYASAINGSTNNSLKNILMTDINSMTITSVKRSFSITGTEPNYTIVSGLSKVYYCFMPNLFNSSDNKVFDVSGNMFISGDVNVNDGGKISTNNATFNLLNETVQTVNLAGNATTITMGGTAVAGKTSIRHQLDVSGNTSIGKTLSVGSDVSMGGNLTIGGTGVTVMKGDVSMNRGLFVQNDTSFGGNLFVKGNLIIDMDYIFIANLTINRTALFNQSLLVKGDISFNGGNLFVSGSNTAFVSDVSMTRRLYVGEDASFGKRLYVGSDSSFNGRLYVGNDASFGANFYVGKTSILSGDVSINSRLYVGSDASFSGKLSVSKDVSMGGNLSIHSSQSRLMINPDNMTIFDGSRTYVDVSTSKLVFMKDVSENIQVRMNDLISRTKYMTSDASDTNTLLQLNKTTNQIMLYGNLVPAPGKKISLGSPGSYFDSLYVNTNTIYFTTGGTPAGLSFNSDSGSLDLENNGVTGTSVLSYGGNVAIGKKTPNSTLDVSGEAVFNGDIYQESGNLYSNGNLVVEHDVSMGGNITIGGYTNIIGNATTKGDASFGSRLFVMGDSSFNGSLSVGNKSRFMNDVSMLNNLEVAGNATLFNATIQSKLFVNSDVSMNGNLYVNNSTIQNGNVTMNSKLFVGGDASMTANINVEGNSRFLGNMSVLSSVAVSNSISAGGNLTVNGARVIMNSDASINGNFSVSNNTILGSGVKMNRNLIVDGSAVINDVVELNSTLTVQSDATMLGDLYNRGIFYGNDASLGGRLLVNKPAILNSDATINSRLFVGRDSSFGGNLYSGATMIANRDIISLNGNVNSGGKITSIGDASFGGNFYAAGKTIFASDSSFNTNLSVEGITFLTGDVRMNSRLAVKGDTTMQGNLYTNGTIYAGGDLIGGRLLTNSDAIIGGALSLGGSARINNSLNVIGDISVNGRLQVRDYGFATIPILAVVGGYGLAVGTFANDVTIGKNLYVGGTIVGPDQTTGGGDSTMYGNLLVYKDLTIGGNLKINQYQVNSTITTFDYQLMIAEDVSINGRLFMTGDASINGRLKLGGNATVNGTLLVRKESTFEKPVFAQSDVSFTNNLYVGGSFTLDGGLSLGGKTTFSGDVSMNSRLNVAGRATFTNDISINNRLFVRNDTSFNARLFVASRTTLNDDASLNSRLFVAKEVSMNSLLYVAGAANFGSDLSVNNRLFVKNDTGMYGNLYVDRFSTLNNDVQMNGNLSVSLNSLLYGSFSLYNLGYFYNDATFYKNVYFSQDLSSSGNLYIQGTTRILKDVSLNNRLFVVKDTSLNGNLYVGLTSIQNGDVSMNSRLYVGKDASFNAKLYVSGKSLLASDLSVNADIYGNNTTLQGNMLVIQRLYVPNEGAYFTQIDVSSTTTFTGNFYNRSYVTEMNDTTMKQRMYVLGDASFISRVYVGSDVSLSARLYVKGTALYDSDVSMISQLDLNGSMIARSNMNVFGVINQYSSGTSSDTIVNNVAYITSSATNINIGTSSSQTTNVAGDIYMNGKVGIGSTSPQCPLYINGYTTSTSQGSGYYYNNTTALSAISTTTPYNYSIFATNSIATADKIIATATVTFSDERIKTDIENIDSKNALEIVRKMQPKRYSYIDKVLQGSQPTWGFIAQEMNKVLDYSVSITKNFIPNIYELGELSNNIIILKCASTRDISLNHVTRLKLFTKNNSEKIVTISEIINDKMFSLVDEIKLEDMFENQIFVYGQEVDDFNNLDKNAIFTMVTAGLQQVDRELQETKEKVRELENQIRKINEKLGI